MKALVLAPLALVASLTHADVIRCSQTEPFITETFDTDKGTAHVDRAGEAPLTEAGLRLVIMAKGKFEIRNADGSVRRALVLNFKGSDGMSDRVYPYDAGAGINGPIGCESSELKARD